MAQSDASSRAVVSTLSLRPGDKVDAFTVVGTIATTGSAVVYKAHDELLDRHVAIKQLILGQGDTDEALRRRIRDEATIHKRVSTTQPRHLIQFIDAVDDPRGLMIVSEFYPSRSLEDVLTERQAPLDERQALGIVAATAKGLEAIHSAGVLHRDLKPSNILLGEDGGLKICDFGISALIEAQDSLSLGSVRYMAPELLRAESADGRADIYSLGMIAYEMLAGRPKFDQAFRNVLRDQRNQAMRWMKWHTNGRVAAPLLSELVSDLPPHLVQLVARMMDKDQSRRVGSAVDVLEAIRRHFIGDKDVLANLPSSSSGAHSGFTSIPGDTAPLPTRSRLPVILGSLLLFWVVVGGAAFLIVQQRAESRLATERAEAVSLIEAGTDRYAAGEFAASLELYNSVLQNSPPDGQIYKLAQLGAWKARGRLAFVDGRYDEAIAQFQEYSDNGGAAGDVEPLILEARAGEAFANVEAAVLKLIDSQAFREGQQVITESRQSDWSDTQVRRLNELSALIDQRRAETLAADRIKQARELDAAGDLAGAIALLTDLSTLPAEGATLLGDLRSRSEYQQALEAARAAERVGNLDEALVAYSQAQAIQPSAELQETIARVNIRRLTADAAQRLDAGEYESARAQIAEALRLDPQNADALRLQARLLNATQLSTFERAGDAAAAAGKYPEAMSAYEEALRINPDNPAVQAKLLNVRVESNLTAARTALTEGQLNQAESLLKAAATLRPDDATIAGLLAGVETQRRYGGLLDQGDASLAAKDFGPAVRLYREAEKLQPGAEVRERINNAFYNQFLTQGQEYAAAGQLVAARAKLLEARKIRSTPEVAELLRQLSNSPAPEPSPETSPESAPESGPDQAAAGS